MRASKHEQRSPEWFTEKWGKIGGSTTEDLMVAKATETTAMFFRLLSEHCEPYTEEKKFISSDMTRGIELEPMAMEEAIDVFERDFEESGWLLMESHSELMGISPDGLTPDNKHGLEIKCPRASTHLKYLLADEVPAEHFWQLITYFVVIDELETLSFMSFRPENTMNPIFKKTLTRDSVITYKKQSLTVFQWVEEVKVKLSLMEIALKSALEKLEF